MRNGSAGSRRAGVGGLGGNVKRLAKTGGRRQFDPLVWTVEVGELAARPNHRVGQPQLLGLEIAEATALPGGEGAVVERQQLAAGDQAQGERVSASSGWPQSRARSGTRAGAPRSQASTWSGPGSP